MERGNQNQRKIAKARRRFPPFQGETQCDTLADLLHSRWPGRLLEDLVDLGHSAVQVFRDDPRLQQALHVLVMRDGMDVVVQWLVTRGCVSLQTRDGQGRTALRLAVQRDKLEYARILLNQGAYDPEDDLHLDPRDQPLLHTAVEWNSPAMVESLVKAGADPYLIHEHHGSALSRAVYGGRHRCVEAILENRARPRDSRSEEEYESLLWYLLRKKDHSTFTYLWRCCGKNLSFPSLDLFIYTLFSRNTIGFKQDIVDAILKGSSGEELIAMHEVWGVFGMSWSSELTFSPERVFPKWEKAMKLRWADPRRPVRKRPPTDLMAEWLGREVQTPRELARLPRTWESTLEQAVLVADRLMPDRPELPWMLTSLAETLFEKHADRRAAPVLFLAALTSVTCEVTEEDDISRKWLFQRVLRCLKRHVTRLTRDELLLLLFLAVCAVEGGGPYFSRRPPALDMKSRVAMFAEPLKSLLRQWFLLREPASPEQEKILEDSMMIYFRDLQPKELLFPVELLDGDTCLPVLELLLRASSKVCTQRDAPLHLAADSGDTPLHLAADSGDTPLHLAADSGDAPLHLAADSGDAPLHLAADSQGDTPLHLAADSEGNTPLHLLARSLPADVLPGAVTLFLWHKADLLTRNKEGESVADILASRHVPVPALNPPSLRFLADRALTWNQRYSVKKGEDIPTDLWKNL